MRATLGVWMLVAASAAVAHGEEIATPHPFARWGLASMCLVADEEVACRVAPTPALHAGPVGPLIYPPLIYGERQLFVLLHHYDRDPLPRKAWRWAHRTPGF